MITADKLRALMPKNKRTAEEVLDQIFSIITNAAERDEYQAVLPKGVFPEFDETEAFYNAKYSPLIKEVHEKLTQLGFSFYKNTEKTIFVVSWKEK